MKTYSGYFISLNNTKYRVDIETPGSGSEELLLGGTPFTTTMEESDSTLYKPLKPQGATVQIIQRGPDYYKDFYASNALQNTVKLYDITSTNNPKLRWSGFVTPNLYSQGWALSVEPLEIECISHLAVLEYYRYEQGDPSSTPQTLSLARIINKCLAKSGVSRFRVHSNIIKNLNKSVLDDLYLNEQVFLGTTKEENMTYKEVLEEVCKYLGVSAVEMFGINSGQPVTVCLVDYDAVKSGWPGGWYEHTVTQPTTSNPYPEAPGRAVSGSIPQHTISADDYRSENTTLSLDNVYNIIAVKNDEVEFEDGGDMAGIFDQDQGLTPYQNITVTRDVSAGGDWDWNRYWETYYKTPYGSSSKAEPYYDYLEAGYGIFDGVWSSYFIKNDEDKAHNNEFVWTKYYKNDAHTKSYFYSVLPKSDNELPPSVNLWNYIGQPATAPTEVNPLTTLQMRGSLLVKSAYEESVKTGSLFQNIPSVALTPYILINCIRKKENTHWGSLNMDGELSSDSVPSIECAKPCQPVFEYSDTFKMPNDGLQKYLTLDFKANYSNIFTRPFLHKHEDSNDLNSKNKDYRFIWASIEIIRGDGSSYHKYLAGRTEAGQEMFAYGAGPDDNSVVTSNYHWTDTPYYNDQTNILGGTVYAFQKSKLRIYFKAKDNYIGQDLELQSNIDWRMNISASSGLAFALPEDIQSGDKIVFKFYMPHSLHLENSSGFVCIKDFKLGVEEENAAAFSGDKEKETTYSITVNDAYSNKLEPITCKLATYNGNKSSYSTVTSVEKYGEESVQTYLTGIKNLALENDAELQGVNIEGVPNFGNKKTLAPEHWLCYRCWKQYSQPRVIYDVDMINSYVSPLTLFTIGCVNTQRNSKYIIDKFDIDYIMDKATYRLIEKA